MKDTVLSFRVERRIREALEKAAKDDGRALANYVSRTLEQHLVRRGYLKAET
jgi:predicted HicB family RNase H-like nuclease